MSATPFDLGSQIDNLRGFKGDLEEIFWATPSDSKARFGLGLAIGQLAQRVAALEEAVRHHGADEIAVPGLSTDDARALALALDLLDGDLTAEGEDLVRLWPRIRRVLSAADEILLAAARGIPSTEAEADPRPRPAVVLPLVRSSR